MQRISGLLLLGGLVVVAFFFISIFKERQDLSQTIDLESGNTSAAVLNAQVGNFDPIPITEKTDTSMQIPEASGEVRAVTSGVGGLYNVNGIYLNDPDSTLNSPTQSCEDLRDFEPQLQCVIDDASLDIRDLGQPITEGSQIRVSGPLNIQILKVTYPGGLYAGLNPHTLSENDCKLLYRRDISMGSASSQVFTATLAMGEMIGRQLFANDPLAGCIDELEEYRQPFTLNAPTAGSSLLHTKTYGNPFKGDAVRGKPGEGTSYTVPVCANAGDPNCENLSYVTHHNVLSNASTHPGNGKGSTNGVALELSDSLVGVGMRTRSRNAYAGCMNLNGDEVDYINSEGFVACATQIGVVDQIIQIGISAAQNLACFLQNDPSANCGESVIVGVFVQPLFGGNDYCKTGQCALQEMSMRQAAVMSPGQEEFYKPIGLADDPAEAATEPLYVKTDCKILVNGRESQVYCYHDVSYIRAEFYNTMVEQGIPCESETDSRDCAMKFETYWQALLREARKNSDTSSLL